MDNLVLKRKNHTDKLKAFKNKNQEVNKQISSINKLWEVPIRS